MSQENLQFAQPEPRGDTPVVEDGKCFVTMGAGAPLGVKTFVVGDEQVRPRQAPKAQPIQAEATVLVPAGTGVTNRNLHHGTDGAVDKESKPLALGPLSDHDVLPDAQSPCNPEPFAPSNIVVPLMLLAQVPLPGARSDDRLANLFQLLRVKHCIFCRKAECSSRMNCYIRRKLLANRGEFGWCFGCDQRHNWEACARLEKVREGYQALDVCYLCLWPLEPRLRASHESMSGGHDAWLERNMKSALGVFLFRCKPYGYQSWRALIQDLNERRRIPALSSGQLLVDLYEFMSRTLGFRVGVETLNWAPIDAIIRADLAERRSLLDKAAAVKTLSQ